jgi:hypothetical protein
MSLLQRLSERAQALKSDQSDEAISKEARKARFQNETIPAMRELERFLRTLNQQLKEVKPVVRQRFEISGYGSFEANPSFDWIFVPGESRINEFTLELRWKSRVDVEKSTKLVLSSVDRIRSVSETFKRLHLSGVREDKRGPTGLITNATVQAAGFVNAKINIRAHIDDDAVQFIFENVDQLAQVKRQIGVGFIGTEVSNRLGEFILRENDLFVREAWVRGLKPEVREVVAVSAPVTAPVKTIVEPEIIEVKAPSAAAAAAAILESAEERELDFLAELKFAARYADSAVKKNLSIEGDSGFGQERDLASLRSAFQRQVAPKVEKLSPFADPNSEKNTQDKA